ncbi:MAG TPA: O-antigen ligase family protein, partial [Actinomycetota bacterium]
AVRGPGPWVDLAGAVAFVGLVAWTFVAAAGTGLDPWPAAAPLAAAGGAYVVARLVSAVSPLVVPLVVVAVGGAVFVAFTDGVLTDAPRGGPFGYSSITGAFFLQCAFGALMLVGGGWWLLLPVGLPAATLFGYVTFATETRAAAALLALSVPALIARRASWARRVVVGFALLAAAALVVTVVVGATYRGDRRGGPMDELLEATVTERREALWHDAIDLMRAHPVRGVGPDGFATTSPTARSDPDEPWAHNAFLQAGADLGVPGLVLLVALFAWAFARLARAASRAVDRARASSVAVAGAALAALAIHGCIEYVLQRPAVPAVTAALVGAALGPFAAGRGKR